MARTILIDGRSGAGKTTFAGLVGEATGFHVIHLDEFYPGWGGLIAVSYTHLTLPTILLV